MVNLTSTVPQALELADASQRIARRLHLMGWADAVIGLHAYTYGGGAVRVAVHVRRGDVEDVAAYFKATGSHVSDTTVIYDWATVGGTNLAVQVYGPAA